MCMCVPAACVCVRVCSVLCDECLLQAVVPSGMPFYTKVQTETQLGQRDEGIISDGVHCHCRARTFRGRVHPV